VSESYPKEIKNWQGLPTTGKLDAALQYSNKLTYFFKDGQYWRFNDNDFEVRDRH
jgi:matrix metalloproteinase-14 (membrane-inserted)